ncbi:MAG: hypothetical protein E3J72_14050 [Planctomycetota bacterium]|nr:MAG: hypothetical protein E3J72_14050 [Planctomycetota bacterium]
MKHQIALIAFILALLISSCNSVQKKDEVIDFKSGKVLSECICLPPVDFWIPAGFDVYGEIGKAYGAKPEDYSYIYEAFRILRVTILSNEKDLIFEIQVNGDIELAMKKYSKRMQYEIYIHDNLLRVFIVPGIKDALLVGGNPGNIIIKVDGNGKATEAYRNSEYKILSKLKLAIDRDRMRVYLPKRFMLEKNEQYYKNLTYVVSSRLALPPIPPIPTNLHQIAFLPTIQFIDNFPSGTSLMSEDNVMIVNMSRGK